MDAKKTTRGRNPNATALIELGGARWGGWAGRAQQDGTPTGLFAQETTLPRATQGMDDNCPGHSLVKRNNDVLIFLKKNYNFM